MYLRDLQSRVQFLRHDLERGFVEQALQDAARWVATKTGVVRTKVYDHVNNGQLVVSLASFMQAATGQFDVLRPTRVMYMPGLNTGSVCVGALTSVSTTIPAPTVPANFSFYVSQAAITVSDGTKSYVLGVGDVIQVVNKLWVIFQAYKYSVAKDRKKERAFGLYKSPMNSVGYMSGYYVDKDSITINPVPNLDIPLMIECSVVPKKDFDTVDFPLDAEECLLAKAKEQLYAMPNKSGGGANEQKASMWRKIADDEKDLVRAVADGGYGDTEVVPPPLFGN
jgi:hypothetical protein